MKAQFSTPFPLIMAMFILSLMIFSGLTGRVNAAQPISDHLIIDDRSIDGFKSNLGTRWRLITDDVMGGISRGTLTVDTYKGKNCLRMRGDVSTENNGGFVQMSLPMSDSGEFDASAYTGVELVVAGNDEQYNIHFRTDDLWFPWQSYRASFTVNSEWQTYRIPFASLQRYRTMQSFSADELERIGLVAIGREFQADLCIASIRFFTE